MQVKSQKTKLSILAHHVDQWRMRAGSRETVATLIVEAHIAAGYNTRAKLHFDTQGDAFMLAKSRADRIFRWLDDKTKDGNFMPPNFEDSILLAMPADICMAYTNEWLGGLLGLSVQAIGVVLDQFDASAHFASVSKEGAEAIVSMAKVVANPTPANIASAAVELSEAETTIHVAREALQAVGSKLKAVA